MGIIDPTTFVIAVNDSKIYKDNFLRSHIFDDPHPHQILAMKNFYSASKAYNEAIEQATNDVIVFAHQDVFLPRSWIERLWQGIRCLENVGKLWGVLGSLGMLKDSQEGVGQIYSTGLGVIGKAISKPEEVDTLDEILLIIRKSSELRFDPLLPNFHLYGADICMSAREKGMICFAIPAFCIHNTKQIIDLPREFYVSYRFIKKRWKKYLPIRTSCIKITKFNCDIHLRRIRAIYRRIKGKKRVAEGRADDPRTILKKLGLVVPG